MSDDRICWCDAPARWWVGPFGDWCCDLCRAKILRRNPERNNIYPIDDHPEPLPAPGPVKFFGGMVTINMAAVQRRRAS